MPTREKPRTRSTLLARLRTPALVALVALVALALTAFMRHYDAARAAALAVDIPASAVPTAPDPHVQSVAYIGDSYSAGAGSDGYDYAFTTLVAAYEGWSFQNFANGGTGYVTAATLSAKTACGSSYCPSYPQMIAKVKAYDPTIVVVSGGRNDFGKPQTVIDAGIQAFYQKLRAALPKATIYATSPLWGEQSPPAQLAATASQVEHSVKAVDGTYLDIGQPLRGHHDYMASDDVHPNDKGHAVIAQAIEVALSKLPAFQR